MRILIICAHRLAFPTIQELAKAGLLAGVATSNKQPAFLGKLKPVLAHYKLPLLTVNKVNFPKKTALFIRNKKVDVVFVLTFKYRIPAKLLTIPKWGFINFHPGPLPQYRGPDPAFWQIKNQLKYGTLTVHQMDAQFDTGPIITSATFPIAKEMTRSHFTNEAGYLAVQLAGAIVQVLHTTGKIPQQAQSKALAAYQNTPSGQDLRINWQKDSTAAILALVNACNPLYGGAHTLLQHTPLQILAVTPMNEKTTGKIGLIISVDENKGLLVACKDGGVLRIDIVQSGEGIMTGNRFVKMARIQKGAYFS